MMLNQVVLYPLIPCEKRSDRKGMFQSLCKVEADITGAPYTSTFAATGRMGYKRSYEVILLVGLTELKAQVCWIDERTVRAHVILHIPIYLIQFLYA